MQHAFREFKRIPRINKDSSGVTHIMNFDSVNNNLPTIIFCNNPVPFLTTVSISDI